MKPPSYWKEIADSWVASGLDLTLLFEQAQIDAAGAIDENPVGVRGRLIGLVQRCTELRKESAGHAAP